MNLGQCIDPEKVLGMRQQERSLVPEKPAEQPVKLKKGARRDQIIDALRGKILTLPDVQALVGGSPASVAYWLWDLSQRGIVKVSGQKRRYRYTVPA